MNFSNAFEQNSPFCFLPGGYETAHGYRADDKQRETRQEDQRNRMKAFVQAENVCSDRQNVIPESGSE